MSRIYSQLVAHAVGAVEPGARRGDLVGQGLLALEVLRAEPTAATVDIAQALAGQRGIYRRESKKAAPARRGYDRVSLNGTVEEAENGERRSFRGIEELWAVLSRPPQAGKRNG